MRISSIAQKEDAVKEGVTNSVAMGHVMNNAHYFFERGNWHWDVGLEDPSMRGSFGDGVVTSLS